MLNRALTSVYDAELRPLGITVSQLNVLVAIATLGPVTSTVIGETLQMDKSTLSRNLERMRRRAWIETRAAEDARSHPLALTRAGAELLERALPRWRQAQEKAKRVIGKEGERTLRERASALLRRVRKT